MKFSVVASFDGTQPQGSWNWETHIDDAWEAATHINPDLDPSELSAPGDSEYAYLTTESCTCSLSDRRIRAAQRLSNYLYENFELADDDETIFRCTWIAEHGHDPANTECSGTNWDRIQGFTVSGIVDRESFESFVQSLGAFPEDVQTLGTLGGPLGGIVSDISLRVESPTLISSIRVTPLPERHGELCHGAMTVTSDPDAYGERVWEKLRSAFIARYSDF